MDFSENGDDTSGRGVASGGEEENLGFRVGLGVGQKARRRRDLTVSGGGVGCRPEMGEEGGGVEEGRGDGGLWWRRAGWQGSARVVPTMRGGLASGGGGGG
jgi:hypothetical protein